MPETRCVKVYENGVLTGEEDCVEVSDEELAVEVVEQETGEENDKAFLAYQNWSSLTLAQKDRVLKALLGDLISRNRNKYIGI